MSNINLFQAAQDVRASLTIDPETGEYGEEYTASRDLFEQKGGACVAYYRDATATLKARQEALKQAQAHLEAEAKHLERFKAYMVDCMNAVGAHKLETADGLFSISISPACVKAVEIDDESAISAEWRKAPKAQAEMPVDKTALRAAIEAGQPVPAGVRIVMRDRVTVK